MHEVEGKFLLGWSPKPAQDSKWSTVFTASHPYPSHPSVLDQEASDLSVGRLNTRSILLTRGAIVQPQHTLRGGGGVIGVLQFFSISCSIISDDLGILTRMCMIVINPPHQRSYSPAPTHSERRWESHWSVAVLQYFLLYYL